MANEFPWYMKKPFILYIVIFAGFFCSCQHYYYVPNVQNVPLFKEKNEASVCGVQSINIDYSNSEVMGAYSVTDNIAVISNFMTVNDNDDYPYNKGNGFYGEGAVGYYKELDENASVEVFTGFGLSKQHHLYGKSVYDGNTGTNRVINFGTSDLYFRKYFIQPEIGFTYGAFDVALSARICCLSFYKINNQILGDSVVKYYPDRTKYFNVDDIAAQRFYYLLEPALTVRGGWKFIKLQLQVVCPISLVQPSPLYLKDKSITIGVYFSLAQRWLKK